MQPELIHILFSSQAEVQMEQIFDPICTAEYDFPPLWSE